MRNHLNRRHHRYTVYLTALNKMLGSYLNKKGPVVQQDENSFLLKLLPSDNTVSSILEEQQPLQAK
jgi:hypothetical protein